MIQVFSQNWWTLVLRGSFAILFAIAAFVFPGPTALAGVFLFAAFAFVDGIFALVAGFGWGLPGRERFLMIVLGLLGVAVGIFAAYRPGIAALSIVLVVAWWAIVSGVIQLFVAVEMRKQIQNEWLFVLGALFSIIFGGLLFWRPGAGVITLVWIFGFYALLYGIMMLSLGFRARSLHARLPAI